MKLSRDVSCRKVRGYTVKVKMALKVKGGLVVKVKVKIDVNVAESQIYLVTEVITM